MADAGIDEQTSTVAMTSIDFLLTGSIIDLSTENRFRQQIVDHKGQEIAKHVALIHENVQEHALQHMAASIKIRNSFSAKEQFEMGLKSLLKACNEKVKS